MGQDFLDIQYISTKYFTDKIAGSMELDIVNFDVHHENKWRDITWTICTRQANSASEANQVFFTP